MEVRNKNCLSDAEIWNFTDVTSTTISLEWVMYNPSSFYEYDVIDVNGIVVDHGNEVNIN